jgi:cytochrome c5
VVRRERLTLTPRHCILLAFIWVFPTILFGFMDWQHFYGGAWFFPIKVKITVAPLLTVLLFIAILLGRRYGATSLKVIPIYFISFCCVVVLGYFGGQLVYGGKTSSSPAEFKAGEKVFSANCSVCHPQGANVLVPSKPIRNSHELQDLSTFIQYVRHPIAPMPPFTASKLPDREIKDLYEYIVNVLNRKAG